MSPLKHSISQATVNGKKDSGRSQIALPLFSVKEALTFYCFLENIADAIWQMYHEAFDEYLASTNNPSSQKQSSVSDIPSDEIF